MTTQFDPQLATSPLAYKVNAFVKAWTSDPPSLVLRPAFQRNMVWNDDQRSYLVDTILRGLPVPEVYIQNNTSPDGDDQIVVVDGQQRISACVDFVLDGFTLSTDEEIDAEWRGKKFSGLSDPLKARFRGFVFVARQLPDLGDAVLRDIFRRLNRTVESLEPQELRHAAYTGPFIQLVERAAETDGLDELGVFTARDALRRRHDEFVSEVLFAVLLRTLPNKKEGLDESYMTYERQGFPADVRDDLVRRFGRVDQFLQRNGGSLKRTRFKNKSDAYSLLYFLLSHADRIPAADSADEEAFTEALRAFSEQVNQIKRAESAGTPTDDILREPHGKDAAKYLRAVERAASDRLSRVRRNEVLEAVLGPLLAGTAMPLGAEDSAWLSGPADQPLSPEDQADLDAELEQAQRVIADETED
ncbi:DUF262 domain-containing protein [Nocardioides acrostichi]|uniref:DUF262 domain-containing protein n=1 Tax=Nocardioides acrostichi TaxID=2784339 RepID=A0A930Y7X3_9ACTN|nr:DUF262 domain-containing protein [Nocardioides acrostichi]MBF4162502.1 DUF262 domain-containing protein [Nocardioides acrostichi]